MNRDIKFSSDTGYEGHLKVTLDYGDGNKIVHYDDHNKVTVQAQQYLLNCLISNQSTDPITTLTVGTGGCLDPQGLFPKPELSSQKALVSPTVSTPVSAQPDSSGVFANFLADIPQSSGNGGLINEVGLFTASGKMFNFKNFPGIPKSSAFSIHFQWTITIAGS